MQLYGFGMEKGIMSLSVWERSPANSCRREYSPAGVSSSCASSSWHPESCLLLWLLRLVLNRLHFEKQNSRHIIWSTTLVNLRLKRWTRPWEDKNIMSNGWGSLCILSLCLRSIIYTSTHSFIHSFFNISILQKSYILIQCLLII